MMNQPTKDSDIDYKETKVSDFFTPKFSYYSELIDSPPKQAATCAQNSIFSALVALERRKTDEIEEEKQPADTPIEESKNVQDSPTSKEEPSAEIGESEISSNRLKQKEKYNNISNSSSINGN